MSIWGAWSFVWGAKTPVATGLVLRPLKQFKTLKQ